MAETKPIESQARTIGVIDIGTNSVRMEIGQVLPDGSVETLERTALPVRLGQDTFVKHQLTRTSMNAAIGILRGYREVLDTYQVEHIRAVATSAVREARNSDAFLDRVYMNTGLDIEIIEPTEETRLTVKAVTDAFGSVPLPKVHTLIADIGGGSALLAMLQKGQTVSAGSFALGSIRIQESLDTAGERPERTAELLRHHVASIVSSVTNTLPLTKIRSYLGVGGDARLLARQVGKPGRNEHLKIVTRESFEEFLETITHLQPDQLARRFKIPFEDAETLTPALLVHHALLARTHAKKMVVVDVSMRAGLLRDLAMEVSGEKDSDRDTSTIESARSIAQKYHEDMAHAEHVATLAVRLFDELRPDHNLTARDRLLLYIASLLHEVGGFINGRAHHKHSYYILSNSEIFGLRANEQEMVANIARYHRRSTPKQTHTAYTALPRDERVVVSKLAAILRIADALERGHSQQVADFDVVREGDEIILRVRGVTDLSLERRALQNKADLFEEIFGMRIRLEEIHNTHRPQPME